MGRFRPPIPAPFPLKEGATAIMRVCEHVFVLIVCALYPRFALLAPLEGRRELLGQAVALAPEPGGVQLVGEVSPAAEAFGVNAGMGLGEALARCPELRLVP